MGRLPPPLRERTEDVPALAMHFVGSFNEQSKSQVEGFSAEALDALCAYSWPGNVRELRNAIEGLYALGRKGRVEIEDLPRAVRDPTRVTTKGSLHTAVPTLEEAQRSLVEAALRETQGNKSEAARLLGISRSRLYHFIQLHRIRA
ncbi:MAG: AAA-type ATPase lid domain-containing protein [Planctomycetota bacterium]